MIRLFCFCASSGTGKSTLINYIQKNFNMKVEELSARPFLPKHMDYVNSLDLFSQTLITQNRFTSIVEHLGTNEPVVFSRSPIDSLAYERVLKKAPYLENLLIRQIKVLEPFITYLYIPVEFAMTDQEDVVRGTNAEVQMATDGQIKKILTDYDIDYITISGSIEMRQAQIDYLFKEWKK